MNKLLACAVLFAAPYAFAQGSVSPEVQLKKTEKKAQEAVEDYRKERAQSLQRHQKLERLREDLRYVAGEIDRERLGQRESLATYSQNCLARLDYLKKNGKLDLRLYDPNENPPDPDRVMTRLEKLCRELPAKTYAAEYSRSLLKAIATELREAADAGKDEKEILSTLKEHLVLPDQDPGEEDAFTSLKLFPVDVAPAQFRKLGAIRIFLVKHRLKRPQSHVKTDWRKIATGQHNAQIGVEIEGTVVRHGGAIDGDYTFDIGDLHIEMTPEWRLTHPDIHKPKTGERVCVRGWSYIDVFHKAEMEYDPEDPVLGVNRVTQWEIHPVQSVQLLPPEGGECKLD